MSYLFEIKDKSVYPTPETLFVKEFRELWERDKSKDKSKALQEMAYVEFIVSMQKSNPFRGYPEDRKHEMIVSNVINIKGWKPDIKVNDAILKLKEMQLEGSTTMGLLIAAKTSMDNLRDFLVTVDLKEVNPKTFSPLRKPKEITDVYVTLEKTVANFSALEKKVEEEQFEATRNRRDKKISLFANPDSLKMR